MEPPYPEAPLDEFHSFHLCLQACARQSERPGWSTRAFDAGGQRARGHARRCHSFASAVRWALRTMVVNCAVGGDLLPSSFSSASLPQLPPGWSPNFGALEAALLVYLATDCTIGASALQLYGQRQLDSIEAAIVYSLEPGSPWSSPHRAGRGAELDSSRGRYRFGEGH